MADPSCKLAKATQFQPIRLPRELDHEALLVLRDGALLAARGLADTDEIESWLAALSGFKD